MVIKEEVGKRGQDEVQGADYIGLDHHGLLGNGQDLFWGWIFCMLVVINSCLHDNLQVDRGGPKGRNCTQDVLFEPVVDYHDAGKRNASLKHAWHLIKGESDGKTLVLCVLVVLVVEKSFEEGDYWQSYQENYRHLARLFYVVVNIADKNEANPRTDCDGVLEIIADLVLLSSCTCFFSALVPIQDVLVPQTIQEIDYERHRENHALIASAPLSLLQFFFQLLLGHFFYKIFVHISCDRRLISVESLPVILFLVTSTVVRPFALIFKLGITIIFRTTWKSAVFKGARL